MFSRLHFLPFSSNFHGSNLNYFFCSKTSLKTLLDFSFLPLNANGQRYVFVADFGAHHCQAAMKFEASHSR
jgi:hypothetical protein